MLRHKMESRMLIERRAYTMRPGRMDEFIDAQLERGFGPPIRQILDRLIAYFRTVSGPTDEVVHLWRFDSFEDWTSRLHSLYGRPELEPYFKTVRSLMVAQQNTFLVPAPLPALTPYWGNGQDWLGD
ncbi:MAG: NIPSNAP family protein, partial [Reyranella sp.]